MGHKNGSKLHVSETNTTEHNVLFIVCHWETYHAFLIFLPSFFANWALQIPGVCLDLEKHERCLKPASLNCGVRRIQDFLAVFVVPVHVVMFGMYDSECQGLMFFQPTKQAG